MNEDGIWRIRERKREREKKRIIEVRREEEREIETRREEEKKETKGYPHTVIIYLFSHFSDVF